MPPLLADKLAGSVLLFLV